MNIVHTALSNFIVAIAVILLSVGDLAAEDVAKDPMLPTTNVEDALVSPLRIVTVITADLENARRFYQGALGMSMSPVSVTGTEAATLIKHWGLDSKETVTGAIFKQPQVPDAAIVRAIEVSGYAPLSRPGYESRYVGPLGFGFPGDDLNFRTRIVENFGYESTAGVKSMDFPRADSTTYTVSEVHFKAPDGILVLGVDRGDMQAIGPIDPALQYGGVAYSSVLVSDIEIMGDFLRNILGLELRRKMSFKSSGPNGGMVGLKKDEEVLFQQWFSPGSKTGYLVVMELLEGTGAPPAQPDMRSRGLSMWSFETNKLDTVIQNWNAANLDKKVVATKIQSPGLGWVRAILIRSPDGVPIEVYEREALN